MRVLFSGIIFGFLLTSIIAIAYIPEHPKTLDQMSERVLLLILIAGVLAIHSIAWRKGG